mgnify:CR=1 FL=1
MAKRQFPELMYLLEKVAGAYGGRLSTANDFDYLSAEIEKKTGLLLSSSTLRRLWGYDNYDSSPRESTLDCLARYVGYDRFDSFRRAVRDMPEFSSGFLSGECVFSRDLVRGDRVVLGWNPNRQVEVLYLGDFCFEVVRSLNAKLLPGDRFEASAFVKGYPMYLPGVERGGENLPLYVAGIKDGLISVQKL